MGRGIAERVVLVAMLAAGCVLGELPLTSAHAAGDPTAGSAPTPASAGIPPGDTRSATETTPHHVSTEPREGLPTTPTAEIVCWGDSMTAGDGAGEAIIRRADGSTLDVSGRSYPDVLQELTGIPTCNFGVSGATSEEIALMQGALQPSRPLADYPTFDADVAARGAAHAGNADAALLLEIGSNGGWGGDYAMLVSQYRAMIAHAGTERYIVIGDTDDPGTSIADLAQRPFAPGAGAGETAWEAALRTAFGERFVNMRVFLVERGLEVAGLVASDEDRAAADVGCVSAQLRADWTHLNSYGYYAQAVAVWERGQQLGYW